ncbi:hypothetical protein BN903_37 [Halorubrum sp. AJ67]|nr:hypothetical protein BN903_37 [Halorubrum sp. AJ67]
MVSSPPLNASATLVITGGDTAYALKFSGFIFVRKKLSGRSRRLQSRLHGTKRRERDEG